MSQNNSLSFQNTKIAFKYKSNAELQRAYWLLKIININFLTKIGPVLTNFAIKIGLPIVPLVKSTIFRHFCGGETIQECEKTIRSLAKAGVGTILDYSVEGEQEETVFETTCQEIIKTIRRAKGDKRMPFAVFKVTGVARFSLLEKTAARKALSKSERVELDGIKDRINRICEAAYQANLPVMIDAEETWIQATIDRIAIDMMRKYNVEGLLVLNTYQLYRQDKLKSLKKHIALAKKEGFILGAKLVRGAYMEKERNRAQELDYPSPIHEAKEHTDDDYNRALQLCLENISTVGLVAGTHNEYSCQLLVDLLAKYHIESNHKHVYFSQLFGMSDHLSFNLANAGYNVAKYVPYGPVKAVLPYLFRRAQENTAIAGQMGRELRLVVQERKRRRLD